MVTDYAFVVIPIDSCYLQGPYRLPGRLCPDLDEISQLFVYTYCCADAPNNQLDQFRN